MTKNQRIRRLEEIVEWLVKHEIGGSTIRTAPEEVLRIRDRILTERKQSNQSKAP